MPRTLADILLEERLLDEPSLRLARRFARHNGVPLVRAVVEQGHVAEEPLAETLAKRLHLPRADLAREAIDDDAMREVPHHLADAHCLLPLAIERRAGRRVMRVAMADPLDLDATEEIELSTGCSLELFVGRVSELRDATARHYRGVITKMIPRRLHGGDAHTKPHRVTDEAGLALEVRALVEALVQRGVLDRDAYQRVLERLRADESDA